MVRRRRRKKMAQPLTTVQSVGAASDPSSNGGGGDAPGIDPTCDPGAAVANRPPDLETSSQPGPDCCPVDASVCTETTDDRTLALEGPVPVTFPESSNSAGHTDTEPAAEELINNVQGPLLIVSVVDDEPVTEALPDTMASCLKVNASDIGSRLAPLAESEASLHSSEDETACSLDDLSNRVVPDVICSGQIHEIGKPVTDDVVGSVTETSDGAPHLTDDTAGTSAQLCDVVVADGGGDDNIEVTRSDPGELVPTIVAELNLPNLANDVTGFNQLDNLGVPDAGGDANSEQTLSNHPGAEISEPDSAIATDLFIDLPMIDHVDDDSASTAAVNSISQPESSIVTADSNDHVVAHDTKCEIPAIFAAADAADHPASASGATEPTEPGCASSSTDPVPCCDPILIDQTPTSLPLLDDSTLVVVESTEVNVAAHDVAKVVELDGADRCCACTYDVPKSLKEVVEELSECGVADGGTLDDASEQLVYDVPPGCVDDLVDDQLERVHPDGIVEDAGVVGNGAATLPADAENVYEEIKRRESSVGADGADESSLFKRTSLVEEVMSEVERVRQRHDQSLQELNLDIENLIMPAVTTPTVSPLTATPPTTCAIVHGVGGGYATNCGQRRPPLVPPHAVPPPPTPARGGEPVSSPYSSSTPHEAKKNHMLSTRTLPPLPGEPAEQEIAIRYPGYSYRRKAPSQRDLYKSKSVPANTSNPSGQTPPSGVKHWLSRLPSLSSFRESKTHSSGGGGGSPAVAVAKGSAGVGDAARWRWSVGSVEEPLYMLYDDTYRLHAATKPFPEDDIYEDIDRDKAPVRTPQFSSTMSVNTAGVGVGLGGIEKRSNSSPECCEDNSDSESLRSSGNMSVASFKGRILNIGRKLSRQHDDKVKLSRTPENDTTKPEGKLTRLFSKRKGYDLSRVKLGTVPDDVVDGNVPMLRMTNCNNYPMLPPPPTGLNADQIKRRCIVTTLVQSENSYVASLKKLVLDYKKPLEDNSPSILSLSKIATLFFRVPEILQCHHSFCISLSACVRRWDNEEKIGDVFISAFSKTSVLDIYSDYINNFSSAMELAKLEAKRKSVFTDFLKVKQITSPDRLSFFGLMVKPVQRFPQFILLLQDLLRHTPQGHHDRMSLQLALTQMEMLADMLNERKRETDQAHAVKDILRHVSARPTVRSLAEGARYLLRQDTLTHLIFNQNGQWTKSKERKLYVLNDLIVCVSSGPRASGVKGRNKSERLSFKWAVPITDVEVQEDASPILNRMVCAMTAGQSSATKTDKTVSEQIEDVQSIYQELNDLIHDFEVTSRISALVSTLKRDYPDLSLDVVQGLSHSIQQSIQQKDEEVKWIDSCCLQFSIPLKTKTGKLQKELLIFQSKNAATKQEWLTDVRLAQLALGLNNSPAWDIPEQDRRPSNKIPLFVKAVPVFSSQDHTEVKCGCFHTTMSNRLLGRRRQDYVWLCSTDGVNSHISVHTLRQMGLRDVFSFDMPECRISSMESVPAMDSPSSESGLRGDTVWMGTESRRILVYCGSDAEHYQEIGSAQMTASVLHIKYHLGQVYVALANGTVAIFYQNNRGYWQMKDFTIVSLGSDPVTCLLPVNSSMFCASGHKVCVLNAATAKVIHNHSVQHDHMGSVYTMAHSGIGLWLNLRNTPLVCLYHAETFQHLQDINITSSIRRVLAEQNRPHTPRCYCVTTLSTSLGLLWIGTNVGVSLSIPLPRLQGMPILGRRANMSYHANVGPVSMILVLQTPPVAVGPEPVTGTPADATANSTKEPVGPGYHHPNAVAAYSQPFRSARVAPRGDGPAGHLGMAKTLPRSWKPPRAATGDGDCSVYGLYGNLLNVREGGSGELEHPTEDDLRRSNPDLIPSLVGTLDRRVRLNSGRPRSLDLANLGGGGGGLHHEFNCEFNSSSEDGGSGSQSLAELPEYPCGGGGPVPESGALRSVSFRDSTTTNATTTDRAKIEPAPAGSVDKVEAPRSSTSQPDPRSVLTLIGGRGYVDLRRMSKGSGGGSKSKDGPQPNPVLNTNDAYAIFWEMKV